MIIKGQTGKAHPAFKHGGHGTDLYGVWAAMRQRCYRPTHPEYHNYGARGITVCPQWDDFATFAADMGPRPAGRSLDRIDNDGWYGPDNCRWATSIEQARNMRTTHIVTIGDETKPLAEWCQLYGINRSTVLKRINRSGWTPEQALTVPRMWER